MLEFNCNVSPHNEYTKVGLICVEAFKFPSFCVKDIPVAQNRWQSVEQDRTASIHSGPAERAEDVWTGPSPSAWFAASLNSCRSCWFF